MARLTLAIRAPFVDETLLCSPAPARARREAAVVGAGEPLPAEQPPHLATVGRRHVGLSGETTGPRARLLLEEVVAVGVTAADAPGARHLEALGGASVGLHLRHVTLPALSAPRRPRHPHLGRRCRPERRAPHRHPSRRRAHRCRRTALCAPRVRPLTAVPVCPAPAPSPCCGRPGVPRTPPSPSRPPAPPPGRGSACPTPGGTPRAPGT